MKRSVTAVVVVMLSMLYAVFCQAQIIGTGQLGAARRGHTATLLQDGKILIVGGDNGSGLVGQAEIFDPASLTSSNIAANPLALRTDHTATLLSDGRVFIIGGVDGNGSLASSEFYNPNSVPAPSFSPGPALMRARSGHTATVLSDGKILIAGGEPTGSAEIFDPATQSFSLVTGSLNMPRQYHSAALLNSGKVLIAGGVVGTNTTLTTAEIYDPQSQTFTPASGPMQTPRGLALLRVLPDGKVQVIGGDGEFSMEMFDPATNSFIALAHIPPHEDYLDSIITSRTRSALITTIIQQNPVLQGRPELTTEFIALLNRLDHTVTEIPQSNQALIAGGVNDAGQFLSSATVVSSSAATITTDKLDYAPGEIVTITGSGFQPNETVWMLLHEEPETHDDVIISSVADSQGNFTNTDFAPAQNDLDRSFTLTAIGQSSGFTTQTAFHDAKNLTITLAGTGGGSVALVDTTAPGNNTTCTASCSPSLGNNDVGTLTATANAGSVFAGWTAQTSGITGCSGSACNFSMGNSAQSVTATFNTTTPKLVFTSAAFTTNSAQCSSAITVQRQTGGGTPQTSGILTVNLSTNSAGLAGFFSDATCTTSTTSVTITNGNSTTPNFYYMDNTAGSPILTAAAIGYTSGTQTETITNTAKISSVTVGAQTGTLTYGTGGSATYLVTVNRGANGNFTANLCITTWSPSQPTGVTFSFLPASISMPNANSSGTSTLTINTTAATPAGAPIANFAVRATNGTCPTASDHADDSGAVTVNKATPTITWNNPANIIYGTALSGTQLNATASVPGTFVYTPASGTVLNAGNGQTLHVDFTPTDTANYNSASKDVTINVLKKDATWTTNANSKTYGDSDPNPLTTGSGSGFLAADNVTATYSRVTGENASPPTYHITATLSATPLAALSNYNIINAGNEFTIDKASSTTTLSCPANVAYTGSALTPCSATVTGAGGLNQSVTVNYTNNTNAGTATASASFAGDANHASSSDSKNFTIDKAASVTTVSCPANVTYTGSPLTPCSATVTGVGGLNQSLTVTYTNNTNAGTATASASFAGDANHEGSSDSKNFTIDKASSTTVVTFESGPYTYRASAFTATANVTGVGGLNQAVAVVYSGDCLNVTSANGCTATATFAGDTNHTGSSDSKSITIEKASSATVVTFEAGPYTYRASAFTATANVTGVGGLNQAVSVVYSGDCLNVTSANGCTATATFAGDTNHTGSSDSKSITIEKASSTTTVTFESGPYTYRASAFTATANVTGVGGLNQAVAVVYSGDCLNVTSANGCTATATFAGDTNHLGSSENKSITITKADASITVNGYTGMYDGFTHGASGSATGVGGVNLNASLNLGSTFINVPGGTAYWTFTGGTNYNDASGSVAIVIAKADPLVTATGNTCTYDGNPCSGSALATGVNGENLTPVNIAYRDGLSTLLVAAPINAGVYQVAARYAGDLNYNPKQSAPATITILQASQAITVTQEPLASAYYNQTFPVAATASSGLPVAINSSGSCSGSGTGSASITMTAGAGTCSITFDQGGDSNYQAAVQVSRNVTALNTAPVAQAQNLATPEDMPLDVTLVGSDVDNGSLTFSIVTPPAHGSLGTLGAESCSASGIGANCTATVTYTPALDFNGSDSFSFKVNDGQADSNVAIVSITVNPVNDMPTANAQTVVTNDATPVAITLTGSDVETTVAANLIFSITVAPAHGVLSGTPPDVTYTPLTNYKGPDFFKFTVTDRGDPDNCANAPCSIALTSPEATVSITVTDGTAPNALITVLRPLTLSNDRDPKFGFTGTDNVTATDDLIFECKMDAGDFSPCGNPTDFTTQYFGLGDGAHTFQVRAKDQTDVTFGGGNTSAPDSYSWTIDATPPDTAIVLGPLPLAITNTAMATFTFNSTENNSTFLCKVDTTVVTCGAGTYTTASLSDGQHTFTVTAKDQAGNEDPTPASRTWTIDTLAPDTTINNGPANPTTSTSATFVFSSANSPGDTYECRLDSASFTSCTSPTSYSNLAIGTHTFEVRGKDAAGNMETSPASYSWTIGAVTLENYTMDSDFKRFDGFDVVFGKGNQSTLKITGTNPDSFHYQIKLTNNTSTPIGAAYGNLATAIITVPGLTSCGGVPCSGQIGSLGDPAFIVRGKKVAHVWPGHHERDDDDDDDDMPVTVKYMSMAQYQANGNSCADNANAPYSSTLPANGAAKCIKITGFSIPVRHAARIRINFQFRLKGTDGWSANAQQLFYSGFVFRATTSVSFGANVQTASDATGLVGAGKKATAIGGYVFSGANPGTGYKVRLFTKMSNASCDAAASPVAQALVDGNGFYYIWRAGSDQTSSTANSLPSGVQYAVQLCNGYSPVAIKAIDSKLRDKEFEQIDFDLP